LKEQLKLASISWKTVNYKMAAKWVHWYLQNCGHPFFYEEHKGIISRDYVTAHFK